MTSGKPTDRELPAGPWGRPTIVDEAMLRRTTAGTAVGNMVEWYDFGVYSYIAVTLGRVFFPSGCTCGSSWRRPLRTSNSTSGLPCASSECGGSCDASWPSSATHNLLAPAFYLAAAGLVGVVAVLFTPESAGQPMPTAPPIATNVEEAHELVREQQRAA